MGYMNPATKIWTVKKNLRRVVEYVADDDMILDGEYVEGINCYASETYEEFTEIKALYRKTDGVLAYHGVLSFPQDEMVTPDLAFEIGKEFVRRNWGDRFQVLVALHTGTDNYHCHYLINSVSFVDGKKAINNDTNWYRLRHVADEIFEEHGLHVDNTKRKTSGKTNEKE